MSADRDRGIRREKQKRARGAKRAAREQRAAASPAAPPKIGERKQETAQLA